MTDTVTYPDNLEIERQLEEAERRTNAFLDDALARIERERAARSHSLRQVRDLIALDFAI